MSNNDNKLNELVDVFSSLTYHYSEFLNKNGPKALSLKKAWFGLGAIEALCSSIFLVAGKNFPINPTVNKPIPLDKLPNHVKDILDNWDEGEENKALKCLLESLYFLTEEIVEALQQ